MGWKRKVDFINLNQNNEQSCILPIGCWSFVENIFISTNIVLFFVTQTPQMLWHLVYDAIYGPVEIFKLTLAITVSSIAISVGDKDIFHFKYLYFFCLKKKII